MKPALPAAALREGSRSREAVLLLAIAVAAVAAALTFDAAVHPEELHHPRHHADFVRHCAALPALGAMRVRATDAGAFQAIFRLRGGSVSGLTPDALGLFRRARYLGASPAEVADAIAKLNRGEAPTPPPAPDLSLYYRDGNGPYLCDLVPAPGVTPAAVREKVPSARLSGEPVARETEEHEAAAIARALLLGVVVLAGWLAWRRGLREAELRVLAVLGVLVVTGFSGAGVDRWSVAALLLVAGARGGASLLAAFPCLLFPLPALHRAGLVLCLGGALRLLLRRPVLPRLPPRRAMARAAAPALALGAAGCLALAYAPLRATQLPAVAAEPGALFVPRRDLAESARRLRAEGLEVTGDAPLVPPPPDPARRRDLWRIFTGARSLARGAEGEMRARFEDASDAASQTSLTTLPRDLRERLLTRDGRAVLWAPADADRKDLASARLYRARGERELRGTARFAGVLVALMGAMGLAILAGAARPVLLRLLGAALGVALLFLAAPAEADLYVPLVPLAALAPAFAPGLALLAAALLLPAFLWPAAAFLVAALPGALSRR